MTLALQEKLDGLKARRTAFEEALARVERIARSSVAVPAKLKQQIDSLAKPALDSARSELHRQDSFHTSASDHMVEIKFQNGESVDQGHSTPRTRSRLNVYDNEGMSKVATPSSDQHRVDLSAGTPRSFNSPRIGMTEEAREHQALMASRLSIWHQNFARVHNWLSSSEAISLDAERNREIGKEFCELPPEM
ncbi:hypothetical protein CYMTET_53840 [Cymbomonas tetramitiformis]|uniref:Uncharacterized protein n=1 Tax=Cymbomonas tetramitiformis TaxID=36881 RepID=A0AAE0BG24_9CHLO|nr:hypothetical protein CYMTET_53840 [Cymbomonas tetramitiformis]